MILRSAGPCAAVLALVGLTFLLAGCGGAPAASPVGSTPYTAAGSTNTVAGSYPAPVLGLVVAPDLAVAAVEPGSGAAQAGVQPGDRLLALDRTPLTSTEQGQQVAQAATIPGDHAVQILLQRGGKELTVLVQPGPPPTYGTFEAPARVTPTPLPPGYGYY